MKKIQISDIESLNKLNIDILDLKKKINNLNEIEMLNKLNNEVRNIENKVFKYSSYDLVDIGNIIVKLMNVFEGVEYFLKKNSNCWEHDYDYSIGPKINDRNVMFIHPDYKIILLKKTKIEQILEKKDELYLPPSGFRHITSSLSYSCNNDIDYIQLFIDYLYEKRSNMLIEVISEKELEEILQEFLEISVELQQKRKIEIEKKEEEFFLMQEKIKFEKSCMIDRKLILNSITEIINSCEENMTARIELKEEWSRGNQWIGLTHYDKLIINYDDLEIIFEIEIGSGGCYPDEEYCGGVFIDSEENISICFFDIKERISPLLNNTNYLLKFMNNIEEMYLQHQNVTNEVIQQFLADTINKNKSKLRALKLNRKNDVI